LLKLQRKRYRNWAFKSQNWRNAAERDKRLTGTWNWQRLGNATCCPTRLWKICIWV